MKTRLMILGAALALTVSTSIAQTNSVPAGEIAQRKQNQQDRIANGIDSGQLTAGETKNLERREANLNRNERQMRAADGGKLTAADRTDLNRQENHISGKIYQDKHNANTAHYGNGVIGQRRENQQDRIAQGIQSGQLKPGETAHLERQQQSINREDAAMRKANGGTLTGADKQALNQRQNNASKNIYDKKHNGRRTRP